MTQLLAHARRNVIAYLALILAVGAGGGYALAASHTKTITACADKQTGVLHVRVHGRCKRSQTRVTWNQQGPQGPQGHVGEPGAPAVTVWAVVGDAGEIASGQGVSVQRVSAGTYQVTVTATSCAQHWNAPTVTVSDSNPPAGYAAGAFPVAWVGNAGTNQQFTIHTGVVAGGTFTPTDHTFNLQDACG